MNSQDWLEDSLIATSKLKDPNNIRSDLWHSFHFATRIKLDGAAYFCRQLLGIGSMPDDIGLPLLAHRQLKWYLDAFFFELMSAYDTLLQELNIVYAYKLDLKPNKVSWDTIKDRLPTKLLDYIKKEYGKEWFVKVRKYRNITAHHYLVPTEESKVGWGEEPLDYDEHQIFIPYLDNDGKIQQEEIHVCVDYLKKMVRFISQVWQIMKEEFQ